MKIGIDARLWSETGVGRYIRNLVAELHKQDQENSYVLFVLSKDKKYIQELTHAANWILVVADIRWHSLAEQFQFPSLIDKHELDLMHFPYFSLPVRYKRPFVVTIHDLIIHHFPTGKASTLPFPLYRVKQQGYRYVLSHATSHAKKILVPLKTVKEDIIESFHIPESNVVVTPEGFDQSITIPTQKPASLAIDTMVPYFLYVGNAYPHKNVETILSAFAEVKIKNKNVQLVLVGKEDYFTKELKVSIQEEIKESVHFIHDARDETLGYLYAHAEALVSASLMEGFGLPALEAGAAKCLLLLSDIPAYRENWSDAAIFFNPRKPDELAERMLDVLSNKKSNFNIFIQEAHKRAEGFSWQNMAKETRQVYEDCNRV